MPFGHKACATTTRRAHPRGGDGGSARAGHGHGHSHDDGRLELRFLGQQIIPTGTRFQDTEVGGLSSIAYDKRRHVFYALSDDQTNVRFTPCAWTSPRALLWSRSWP
jgi:hypothetical protein